MEEVASVEGFAADIAVAVDGKVNVCVGVVVGVFKEGAEGLWHVVCWVHQDRSEREDVSCLDWWLLKKTAGGHICFNRNCRERFRLVEPMLGKEDCLFKIPGNRRLHGIIVNVVHS